MEKPGSCPSMPSTPEAGNSPKVDYRQGEEEKEELHDEVIQQEAAFGLKTSLPSDLEDDNDLDR
jgi:hypothetical protein